MRGKFRLAWALPWVIALAGCTTNDLAGAAAVQGGIPGSRAKAEIEFHGELAGYLDAGVETGGRKYRFLFPDSETCRSILTEDREVSYVVNGRVGELSSGTTRCVPAGVLQLTEWRRKGGRVEGEGIKRSEARYEIFERTDGVALARGRFPLFSRLGFGGAYDLIAVIPDVEECAGVLASKVASMEYRTSGRRPLTLIAGKGSCALMGVIFVDSVAGSNSP